MSSNINEVFLEKVVEFADYINNREMVADDSLKNASVSEIRVMLTCVFADRIESVEYEGCTYFYNTTLRNVVNMRINKSGVADRLSFDDMIICFYHRQQNK